MNGLAGAAEAFATTLAFDGVRGSGGLSNAVVVKQPSCSIATGTARAVDRYGRPPGTGT